ncbi:MAG: CpaF family protein [Acidimicrobiia bacterium]|nr:CpaF family protein [Acidimicrobiia bacterium]
MNEVDRLVRSIVRSSVPLDRASVAAAASVLKQHEAPLASDSVVDRVADAVVGLGPLEDLVRDRRVSDILVNRYDDVWVERAGELMRTGVRFSDPEAVVAAVRRVIAPLGLRIDRAVPAVDARLPDGSRLHAVIPPASVDGPVVAIRRFTRAVETLEDLVESGAIDETGAEILRSSVLDRRNIVVCGGTGAGKTTLLNVLASVIPATERVVTIEDAAELDLGGHVVRLEARPPNVEGTGEITIRSLLVHALRLRPDRIVVGEVRGDEAADMIQALNTGHAGSMSTVHANDPRAAVDRIEVLAGRLDRVRTGTVRRQVESAIDLLVHVQRHEGRRAVQAIVEMVDGSLEERYPC